jgi:hypothetical protein
MLHHTTPITPGDQQPHRSHRGHEDLIILAHAIVAALPTVIRLDPDLADQMRTLLDGVIAMGTTLTRT